MVRRFRLILSGRVQGVGLRWQIARYAQHAGLGGWVSNLSDGGTMAEVEGQELELEKFIKWLEASPGWSRVSRVTREELPLVGEIMFTIR